MRVGEMRRHRRLEDAAVEICIVILYHMHRPVSTKRCHVRTAAVDPVSEV